MKVSELIEALESIKAESGDLEVCTTGEDSYIESIDFVSVETTTSFGLFFNGSADIEEVVYIY